MTYEETKLKIDALKESIAVQGKLTDDQLKKINYKFRLEWNYNSNSMEGNTLTVAETRSVMVGNIDVHQKPYKHVAEMKGHDEVISEILKIGKGDLRLSESRIRQIHTSIIYEEAEEMKELVGDWKKQNNHVINRKGEKFDFIDWELVPDKIHDLLNRTNAAIDAIQYGKKKDVKHPLDIAFDFHLEYLTIHPFYDGNGRTARILTNLILISFGYPPFWINEKEKEIYYAYLTDIQGYGGDRRLLDAYMSGLVLRSQQLVADVIEGKDIEEEDDLDKEIAIWKRQIGEDQNVQRRTDILITELYFNAFKKLFSKLIEKTSQFDELFNKKMVINLVSAEEKLLSYANGLEYFDNIFENLKEPLRKSKTNNLTEQVKNVQGIELEIFYDGFKKDGLNTFGVSITILIEFDTYKYQTYILKNKKKNAVITKLYSEEFTQIDMKRIVKIAISNLFDDIKSSIKN